MKIALIACSKTKQGADDLTKKFRADELYLGNSFKKAKNEGVKMYNCDDYFIISAEHHLIEKDKMITYYDKTLNNMREGEKKEWSLIVLKQLAERFDLENDEFYIFGGSNYYKYLFPYLNCTVFKYRNSNTVLLNEIKAVNRVK